MNAVKSLFGDMEIHVETPKDLTFEVEQVLSDKLMLAATFHSRESDLITLRAPSTPQYKRIVRRLLRPYNFSIEEITKPEYQFPHLLFKITDKKRKFLWLYY